MNQQKNGSRPKKKEEEKKMEDDLKKNKKIKMTSKQKSVLDSS